MLVSPKSPSNQGNDDWSIQLKRQQVIFRAQVSRLNSSINEEKVIFSSFMQKPLKVTCSLKVHVVMTSQPNLGGHKSGPHVVATIFLDRGGHNFCG